MRQRFARMAVALTVVSALVAVAGCAGEPPKPAPKPRVSPPAIAKAGVLRAAVDLAYPPFGGVDKGRRAGLDLDVASALADKLGLALEVVDAKPEDAARLLEAHKVDVIVAALTIDQAVSLNVAFAGSYLSDAPAAFSAKEATVTAADLAGRTVAVQKDSRAYWILSQEYGEDLLVVMPTLRDALAAAASGQAEFAAGDGIVGAYLLRSFPTLRFNGQIAPATPIGVGTAKDAPRLETAVRTALDELAAQGVMDTLRRKWVGDLPRFVGASIEQSATP